uniref:Uncharacterized protein n=1 Tax=Arundo donax TaxID=35708 RepID=A0A0A9AL31_ARUDO
MVACGKVGHFVVNVSCRKFFLEQCPTI